MCAPAGYHYGSWVDGPVAAFTLSQNSPPTGFTQGNGQPVRPTQYESPISAAIKKYCATATSLACSLYTGKVVKCQDAATIAYSILLYERSALANGATPRQAVELTVRTMSRSTPMIHPDDLIAITKRAQNVPTTMTPESFQAEILSECIDAVSD